MLANAPSLRAEASPIGINIETHNASTYLKTWNQGRIEPNTWLNASAGTAQMANGETFTDAEQRFKWLKFDYGVSTISGTNVAFQTPSSFDFFNVYAFSDNATYWRTEANKTHALQNRNVTLSLEHRQALRDDYVTQDWRLQSSSAFNSPTDLWLAIRLKDIDLELDNDTDLLNYEYQNDSLYSRLLNDGTAFAAENVTMVSIGDQQSSRGWRFIWNLDELPYASKLVYQPDANASNGILYIAFKLGKTFSSADVRLQQIDASCQIACGQGDSASVNNFTVLNATSAQVGKDKLNFTVSSSWNDVYGTCVLVGNGCYLGVEVKNAYGSRAFTLVDNYATEGNYVNCPTNLASNCTSHDYYSDATVFNPAKNTKYYWNLEQTARYNYVGTPIFLHSVRGSLTGIVTSTAKTLSGTDTTTPSITCSNPANGSVLAPNPVAECQMNDSGGGFVNVSMWWDNVTGSMTIYDETDNYTGLFQHELTGLSLGRHQICYGVNDTQGNANWTIGYGNCYEYFISSLPNVTLLAPPNSYLQNDSSTVNFTCNASSSSLLDRVELWGNWSNGWHANASYDFADNQTFTHTFQQFVEDGYFEWNCKYFDVDGLSAFAPVNLTFGVENQSEHAIEKGIRNVTPNASIHGREQVYIVDENADHFLGRFDKTSELGNQTWAFNYVTTPIETGTNMPSMKQVINVWENQTLTLQQIFNQVTAFISNTLFS